MHRYTSPLIDLSKSAWGVVTFLLPPCSQTKINILYPRWTFTSVVLLKYPAIFCPSITKQPYLKMQFLRKEMADVLPSHGMKCKKWKRYLFIVLTYIIYLFFSPSLNSFVYWFNSLKNIVCTLFSWSMEINISLNLIELIGHFIFASDTYSMPVTDEK